MHRKGRPFAKGILRTLLGNVLYKGSIRHKGTVYPGEQPALVEEQLWKRVNERLHHNGRHQLHTLHKAFYRRWRSLVDISDLGEGHVYAREGAISKTVRNHAFQLERGLGRRWARWRGRWR